MIRRDFLAILAGSPFIFGLRELLAQEPAPKPDPKAAPDWYASALKSMKELNLPGVVLIVPEGIDPKSRLARALLSRLKDESSAVHEILTGCVLICLPEGILKPPSDSKEFPPNRVLLDTDGARVADDFLEIGTIEESDGFVSSFRMLLHGKDRSRLDASARKIREASTPETLQALKDLDAEDIATREKAAGLLLGVARRIQPLLVHTRITSESGEVRTRAAALLEKLFLGIPQTKPGPRLPFGTMIVKRPEVEPRGADPCPGCGMSVIGPAHKEFLEFLKK